MAIPLDDPSEVILQTFITVRRMFWEAANIQRKDRNALDYRFGQILNEVATGKTTLTSGDADYRATSPVRQKTMSDEAEIARRLLERIRETQVRVDDMVGSAAS